MAGEPELDLLADSQWRLTSCAPHAWQHPWEVDWSAACPATVPGSVAGALGVDDLPAEGIDGRDWWFATEVDVDDRQTARLQFEGVATHWTAWWDQHQIAEGTSMFLPGRARVNLSPGHHRLVLLCAGLDGVVVPRRPRPQWRTPLLDNRLRWFRTSASGRTGTPGSAPVAGPWLPVRLTAQPAADVLALRSAPSGRVSVVVDVHRACQVSLAVGAAISTEDLAPGRHTLSLDVPEPRRWWPRGYGEPHAYPMSLVADGTTVFERLIGFSTIERAPGDDFALLVNGEPVDVRGVCWVPIDATDLAGTPEGDEATLRRLTDAGVNTIRVTGDTSYLPDHFHRLCVELGLLVWHDLMLHTLAPVEDEHWLGELDAEVRHQLGRLQAMPHIAVVSGGSETEQQSVLWGLPSSEGRTSALDRVVPTAVADVLPTVVQVSSTPSLGWRPTTVGSGIAHYFGVGVHERPLHDARTSGVRFAAECLALGLVPEQPLVEQVFGAATTRSDEAWRGNLTRDARFHARDGASTSADYEQTTARYAQEIFGIDVEDVRSRDRGRALDLLRATAAHVIGTTTAEWRRPASPCRGAIIRGSRDLVPGPGTGLLDSSGAPKSAWWALRRVWSPRAILLTDEGLDSIAIHLVNDTPLPWYGTLRLLVSDPDGRCESVETNVEVPARGSVTRWAEELLEAFRDLNHAWKLAPPGCDAVTVEFGDEVSCLLMPHRLRAAGAEATGAEATGAEVTGAVGSEESDPGPVFSWSETPQGRLLTLTSDRTHAFIALDSTTHVPQDNWFHLGAGTTRRVLFTGDPRLPVQGSLRCLDRDGVQTL